MIELIEDYWLYFLIGQFPDGPLGGLVLTLLLGVSALLLALPLGVLLGLARASRIRALSWPVGALVYLVRGTPLLMVIFWAYFFLPALTGHDTSQFATMLAALAVFNGAYLAEIVRAGIQGIPRGQTECARALGLNYWQTMRAVVLPQALRNMLPSVIGQLVTTLKETSLGYIIGLSEVSFIASQVNAQVITRPAEVYAILALTYFVLCFGLSRIGRALESRLSQHSSGSRVEVQGA
ncbi:MAG: amino acid ABC transporter permease [Gammaproteobacteria bacterium]